MTQFFKQLCQNGTHAIHFGDFIFTTNMWLSVIFWMSPPWVSVTLSLIVPRLWVILQVHESLETKPGSSSQWEWTLLLHHVFFFHYFRWTRCFDTKKQVADVLLQNYNIWRGHIFLRLNGEHTETTYEIPFSVIWTCVCVCVCEIRYDIRGGPCNYTCESRCR